MQFRASLSTHREASIIDTEIVVSASQEVKIGKHISQLGRAKGNRPRFHTQRVGLEIQL